MHRSLTSLTRVWRRGVRFAAILSILLAMLPAGSVRAQDDGAQPTAPASLTSLAEMLASAPGLTPAPVPDGVELPAHSHAVLEAWPQPVGAPALAWQWAALPAVAVASLDWRQAVAVPARDLSLAGRALLEAAGRLGRGLLRLAASVLVRPWVASHAGRGVVWRIRWGLRSG